MGSTAKWTARSSSGERVRAYWMARAVARSIRSMKTRTTWRRSTGDLAGHGGVLLQLLVLVDVLAVEPQQERAPRGGGG